MTAATVTVRELKNKDTGIDLSIPTYKENKGILGSSYDYHVMVVSNLSYFKTVKHKQSDNVQFVVPKKFTDFEDLYSKMNTKYSGTAFPPLPKRVLMVSDVVAKERRSGLEYILKFLAMTPKLCTCPLLLEFLGVKAAKIGPKIKKLEVSDKVVAEQGKQQPGTEDEGILEEETTEQAGYQRRDFFEEGEAEDDEIDMFSGISAGDDETGGTKLFAEQELGGGIEEGESEDLFLAGAKIDNTQNENRNIDVDTEDNSDLFMIDDDLEMIMTLDLKQKPAEIETTNSFDENTDMMIETHVRFTEIDESLGKTNETLEVADKSVDQDSAKALLGIRKESITDSKLAKPDIKSKPNIPKKPKKKNDHSKLNVDAIASEAEKIVSTTEQPKPAPRRELVSKEGPGMPAKQTSIVSENPFVPNKPLCLKDKPIVPKRPEIVKEKPNLPKKPETIDKPKLLEKSKSSEPSDADQHNNQDIAGLFADIQSEDDVLKYIQENIANEEDVDLFS